jgi:ABC-type oligopeptide transport system ATPase subunit
MSTHAILDVDHVSKEFMMGGLLSRKRTQAVIDVSFSIEEDRPEVFTILGESGSGKTTLARIILGLESPTTGEVRLSGRDVSYHPSRAERIRFMQSVQPVFQNPFESFNPLKHVDRYLESTARVLLGEKTATKVHAAMDDALQKVGLSLAEVKGRFAHELSGGQLQRVAIARALISNPSVLVADEPVSMVDASLRMSIVNLLRDLRDTLGVTVIYITHDLATAYYVSDRIIIMQKGYVVEMGPAQVILSDPEHPYSQLLKNSVLSVDHPGHTRVTPPERATVQAASASSGRGSLVERKDGRFVRITPEGA